jgi:hypothetical protein
MFLFPTILNFFSLTPKCSGTYPRLGITGLEEHLGAIECKSGNVEVQWNSMKKRVPNRESRADSKEAMDETRNDK